MTASQSFKIYEILQKHFNNADDAKIVVQEIEQIVEQKISAKQDIFLVKDDKIDLIDRINKAKVETIIWIVSIGVLQFIGYLLTRKFM